MAAASPEPAMFELESEAGPSLSRDSVEAPERPDSASLGDEATAEVDADADEIELSRRALPVVQPEADNVCSICLDEFTADDPGQQTQCRCVAWDRVDGKLSSCKCCGFAQGEHARSVALFHWLVSASSSTAVPMPFPPLLRRDGLTCLVLGVHHWGSSYNHDLLRTRLSSH